MRSDHTPAATRRRAPAISSICRATRNKTSVAGPDALSNGFDGRFVPPEASACIARTIHSRQLLHTGSASFRAQRGAQLHLREPTGEAPQCGINDQHRFQRFARCVPRLLQRPRQRCLQVVTGNTSSAPVQALLNLGSLRRANVRSPHWHNVRAPRSRVLYECVPFS
jgi:hypothetical protein